MDVSLPDLAPPRAIRELPAHVTEEYGWPPLTEQAKRKILGGNLARLHGFDVAEKAAQLGAPV